MLDMMPRIDSPDLIVGIESMDDAGVFRLSDDYALVQTVDFFAPAVNDPLVSGRIAAANCMSDIWAMGGRPITAMNLLAFPAAKLPVEAVSLLLTGAGEKLVEAGTVLVGGHSADQKDILFGMSVTGLIHPSRARRNSTARAGDLIVLTKPVGSGILCTALKDRLVDDGFLAEAASHMERLNMYASGVLSGFDVSAMTDVTGFGVAGHAIAMARSSGTTLEIDTSMVPLMAGALELASRYLPGGTGRNFEYCSSSVETAPGMDERMIALMMDSQTSGGLMACVRQEQAADAVAALQDAGDMRASVIGRVLAPGEGKPVRLL
ncbi:selenide, water dikinase SelD [Candidatus Fermentibacteria bacterium]|nr:selenide, water dikinase SelD [Candidatus Fermentibacteria bacterium]